MLRPLRPFRAFADAASLQYHSRMIARAKLVIVLAAVAFVLGIATARAAYGWFQYSTPCVPTGVALTGSEIAIICPGDEHVYIKQR